MALRTRHRCLIFSALAVACAKEAEPPAPLKYPGSEGAKALVVLIDDGGDPRAEAYDLQKTPGVAPENVGLGVIQALYFTDDLETLQMKAGTLELTDDQDLLGRRIPIFDAGFEVRLEGGAGEWTRLEMIDETYYRYRDNSVIRGSVRRWASVDPLESVRICVANTPAIDCVETLAGQFEIEGFVPDTEVVLTLERGDLLATAVMISVSAAEIELPGAFFVFGQTELDTLTSTLGATPDLSTKGVVDFITLAGLANTVRGVVGELSPQSGQAYGHEDGGIIFDADPGEYRLFLSHPTRDFCGPSGNAFNWPGTEANEVRVKVLPGFITHVQGIICSRN